MKTIAIIAIIAIAAVGIILGLIAYSYTQIHISLENVSYQGLDVSITPGSIARALLNGALGNWLGSALDIVTGVKIGLGFALSNHGFVPVYIPDISYDLLVNDVKVGQGHSHIDETISPGQTKSIKDNQDIQFNSIKPAVVSIVDSGGTINFKVSGTAYFNLLGLSVPVPFEYVKQVNVVDELKSRIFGSSQNSEYSSNSYQPTQTSTPNQIPSNSQLPGFPIANSVYRVGPHTYTYIPFNMQCSGTVTGEFSAQATLGDNIIVYVMDPTGFSQFQSGGSAYTYYNSGKVASGTLNIGLTSGQYYLILSNSYSTISTKNVAVQVSYTCR